jgi:hypothetical protein
MIGIGFAALKLFLGGALTSIKTFIADNWKWLLPLVAALFLWWYVTDLQNGREVAIKALNDYVASDSARAKEQQAENQRKDAAAAQLLSQGDTVHKDEIAKIRKDSDAKLHDTIKVAADSSDAVWRGRLRDAVAADRARTVSELSGATPDPAKVGGNCDAAVAEWKREYNVLETACAVTTVDYNSLHDAWDMSCKTYGCKQLIPAQ